jgi:putative transposase
MKNRYSEEQIVGILKEGQSGGKIEDLCRRHGISAATYFRWQIKYSGVGIT